MRRKRHGNEKYASKTNRIAQTCNGMTLKYENCVKYLGLEMTYNGKNNQTINSRIATAERVSERQRERERERERGRELESERRESEILRAQD